MPKKQLQAVKRAPFGATGDKEKGFGAVKKAELNLPRVVTLATSFCPTLETFP